MSASPAIIKEKFVSTFQALRNAKSKLRKDAALLRKAIKVIGPPPMREPIEDDAPPTRKELEQKATELGIKYDGRWNDKRLTSVIAEKV